MRKTKTVNLRSFFDNRSKRNKTKINMDSYIIQVYYKIGIFFAISCSGRNSRPTIWNKFSGTILACVVFVVTICSIINRIFNEWTICNISQAILELAEMIVEFFYMICAFLGASKNIRKWSEIFVDIKKIDQVLESEHFSVRTATLQHFLILIFFTFFYCCLHNYEIWLWKEDFRIEAGYIFYRIIMYYQFFIIFFAMSVTRTLRAWYTFILQLLTQVLSEENAIIQRNKHNCQRLVKIKEVFSCLWRIVQNFNRIFGWLIFLGTFSSFLACLGDLNYILGYYNTEDVFFNVGVIMTNVMYVSAYSVSIR